MPIKKKSKKKAVKQAAQRGLQAGYLTVGQTARILGVSSSTLRVWENIGLVTPSRSNGKFRMYTPEMLEVLKRIKYLREVQQHSVPSIQQILKQESKGKTRKAPAQPRPSKTLGPRLRTMRKAHTMGIVQAATRAGISPGFLSAIELSKANASVSTLQRLAAAYGTTTLEFFDLPERGTKVVRPVDRRVLSSDNSVSMELLSIGTKMLQCMIFRVPPGGGSGGAYSHEGEEFVYVLSGEIEFWLDETECHSLHEGDSFCFDSTQGHRFLNTRKQEAVLLWVNTPITF